MKSEYLVTLENEHIDVAKRYKDKIKKIGSVDPFTLSEDDLDGVLNVFPPVTSFDIFTYLLFTHSFYTKEQMRAYKSLAGFKYFESGYVQVMGTITRNSFIVVIGKVKHSQRTTLPPLNVWVICASSGAVDSAHCTCMAGASEVCSHVAAVLYCIEHINTSKQQVSCTDVKAKWVMPSTSKVHMAKLSEMGLKKSRSSKTFELLPLNKEAVVNFLSEMEQCGESAAIMRVVEPFATKIGNSKPEFLNSVFNIYDKKFDDFSYEELCATADSLNISLTVEQCREIFEKTMDQAESQEWFNQRAGRITASHFKNVCRTKIYNPSISLIKAICYPLKFTFKTKATEWGIHNEKVALQTYEANQNLSHTNFVLQKSGLCIAPEMPAIAASPDGLTCCECCGEGCVEVKCPYSLKNLSFEDYLKLKNSCLTVDDDKVILKRDHSYYFQVQTQLYVSKRNYCDFIVWSPKGYIEERIFAIEDFWASEYPKALEFHKKVILPELLAMYFTKGKHLVQTWCLCDSVEDGRPMLQCENFNCEIQWFHLDCIGLADVPNSLWLCKNCKENI